MSCVTLLGAGSCVKPETIVPDTPDGPLFCDVEEPRRFSQKEVDYRVANFPANFRRDIKTNSTYERECLNDNADNE